MLTFLSKIYSYFAVKRKKDFDSGKIPVVGLSIPVFSVGNISAGGTGKTPFTIMLAKFLKDCGHRPAVVGRGYRRKSRGEVVVSDGKSILCDAETGGDEMLLVAQAAKVPVIAHDKKYIGALSAEKMFGIDCLIIDDGFQHRYLARDIDIVLIDRNTLDNPHVWPKGRLREPIEFIAEADIIVCPEELTGTRVHAPLLSVEKFVNNDILKISTKITAKDPYYLQTAKKISADLPGEKVIAFSGLGQPDKFEKTLADTGFRLEKHFIFKDHYNYSKQDIIKISKYASDRNIKIITTTEKDAVKIKKFGNVFDSMIRECIVCPIETEISEGRQAFEKRILSAFD
ncbi:MAG: tetraacyldisaccharide 4'-kinase [Candidatus Kapabacteria bacterium]|jgi:tetraacyldisaccharide 4'-kinase|nr:tetraacyldisaccharide 4'-kinase [Candidatus Kapabacteria bacterium]